MKTPRHKSEIIAWLKENGYEEMEPNSYANDYWNVVFEQDCIAVANGNGDADYLPGHSLYAVIGYLHCHGANPAIPRQQPTLDRKKVMEIDRLIKFGNKEVKRLTSGNVSHIRPTLNSIFIDLWNILNDAICSLPVISEGDIEKEAISWMKTVEGDTSTMSVVDIVIESWKATIKYLQSKQGSE